MPSNTTPFILSNDLTNLFLSNISSFIFSNNLNSKLKKFAKKEMIYWV